jgi:hypothetical protein
MEAMSPTRPAGSVGTILGESGQHLLHRDVQLLCKRRGERRAAGLLFGLVLRAQLLECCGHVGLVEPKLLGERRREVTTELVAARRARRTRGPDLVECRPEICLAHA